MRLGAVVGVEVGVTVGVGVGVAVGVAEGAFPSDTGSAAVEDPSEAAEVGDSAIDAIPAPPEDPPLQAVNPMIPKAKTIRFEAWRAFRFI